MSLVRAFTTRRNKPAELEISAPTYITRAASQRGGRPVKRTQISSPVALVSTSNMHIHDMRSIGSASPMDHRNISPSSASSSSSDDSDASTGSSIHSTSETMLTDASSVDCSPIRTEPEPNHLSCYFKPAVQTQLPSEPSSPTIATIPESPDATPRLPQRMPSHSKKAHERLHRKRSIQRMLSPPPSRDGMIQNRSSTEIFSTTSPRLGGSATFVEAPRETSNPFGKELAQLEQVAEEFGAVVRDAEADAEAVFLETRGLGVWSAEEYMGEIQGLVWDLFADERPAVPAVAMVGGFF